MKDKTGNLWEFHNGEFNQVDFEITINPKDFESIPSISLETLTSQQFVTSVLEASSQGRFVEPSKSIIPMKSVKLNFQGYDAFLDEWGTRAIRSITDEDLSKRTYADKPETVPLSLAGIWKLDAWEARAFFILGRITNPDGTEGFEGFIEVPKNGEDLSSTLPFRIIDWGFNSGSRLASPLYFSKNTKVGDGCKVNMSDYDINVEEFCTWYYDHPEITLPRAIYENWQRTGILSNTIGDQSIIPISIWGADNTK